MPLVELRSGQLEAIAEVGRDRGATRQARADGHPHGQGCGHNLFGAGSAAAAIALKRTMDANGMQGTVQFFGSPAEETLVGKVYMANAGVFDGIDITIDWHPFFETNVNNSPGQAMNSWRPPRSFTRSWPGRR